MGNFNIMEVLSLIQTFLMVIVGPWAYIVNSRLVKIETKLEMLCNGKGDKK